MEKGQDFPLRSSRPELTVQSSKYPFQCCQVIILGFASCNPVQVPGGRDTIVRDATYDADLVMGAGPPPPAQDAGVRLFPATSQRRRPIAPSSPFTSLQRSSNLSTPPVPTAQGSPTPPLATRAMSLCLMPDAPLRDGLSVDICCTPLDPPLPPARSGSLTTLTQPVLGSFRTQPDKR